MRRADAQAILRRRHRASFADYTEDELRAVLTFMRDGLEVSEAQIDRNRGAGTQHASRPR